MFIGLSMLSFLSRNPVLVSETRTSGGEEPQKTLGAHELEFIILTAPKKH